MRTLVAAVACATLVSGIAGCAGATRRFPLREPVWRDSDLDDVVLPCRADPEAPKEDPGHQLCTPAEYESSFAWDAADQTLFRPAARFFAVDPGDGASNVNAVDEVPDSSWFTNRLGKTPMSVDDVVRGACPKEELDPDMPAGSWVIDMGKPNGANPGFRVKVEKLGKYMIKADEATQPERATAATAIASRFYYAAGWYAPCDSVFYIERSLLKLKPGLTFTDNSGVTRPFDEKKLDTVLQNAAHRGSKIRVVASKWLPGRAIGPFTYQGVREDDPNDVIPHEDRRDLRGARVIAAWLNHFDSREQNSMSVWMARDEKKDKDASPGHVVHYAFDFNDCFGSEWDWEEISKRLGHAYYFDPGYVLTDFVTLGVIERPWDRATRESPGKKIFGFFSAKDFAPEKWRGGYPNPAFARMTEGDAAWATRILARFTPEMIEATVREVGDLTDPDHASWLARTLVARRQAILVRWFGVLSPMADVKVDGDWLCAVDLARRTETYPASAFHWRARVWAGAALAPRPLPPLSHDDTGRVCAKLAHAAPDGGDPDAAEARYTVLDLTNGRAPGPLRVHLYDLGPARGFRVAGIERPDDADPPAP